MTVWKNPLLATLYTLSPTHCGTGQTAAAVDLPIAREAHLDFPVLPATSLKGVARDKVADANPKDATKLFGPDTSNATQLEAGYLLFSEAKLITYPMRSLNRPFLYVTCPLILERLGRDLRAFGYGHLALADWKMPPADRQKEVWVADKELDQQTLVLEDLVFENVTYQSDLKEGLAQALSKMLPDEEAATRQRLQSSLVIIPDAEFQDALRRVVPVRARIKLGEGKTTKGTGEDSGNLWYEEHLPSDCLFVMFVAERRRRSPARVSSKADYWAMGEALTYFWEHHAKSFRTIQIGGNETVGYGLCWWTFRNPAETGETKK